MNKKQASLIARVSDGDGLYYFLQLRDNKKSAPFQFPGVFSLFGGAVEDGEQPISSFFREMAEELGGLDPRGINTQHRLYRWRQDLDSVEARINDVLCNNFNVCRGFDYNSPVPDEALGKDRGKKLTYREFITSVDEDHFYVAEFTAEQIRRLIIKEGRKGVLMPAEICSNLILYPTDKLALMHDYAITLTSKLPGDFGINGHCSDPADLAGAGSGICR